MKEYNLTFKMTDDKKFAMNSENNGFSVFELIGLLTIKLDNLHKQFQEMTNTKPKISGKAVNPEGETIKELKE